MSKYVDDVNADSLVGCRPCGVRFIKGTYDIKFDEAEHKKFLDMRKYFAQRKPGERPKLRLRPYLKNEKALRRKTNGYAKQIIV